MRRTGVAAPSKKFGVDVERMDFGKQDVGAVGVRTLCAS